MGSKATEAKPKERLRPGQFDGLVLSYMKKHKSELPITATKVARGTKRSSGAVGNAAYGERRYVTLGSERDGWDQRSAEEELENILVDVRRGIWVPPTRKRKERRNGGGG